MSDLSRVPISDLVDEIARRNRPVDDAAVTRLLRGRSVQAVLDWVDAGVVTADQARAYLRRVSGIGETYDAARAISAPAPSSEKEGSA